MLWSGVHGIVSLQIVKGGKGEHIAWCDPRETGRAMLDVLMRGTEGEPVADARRQPKFEVFIRGQRTPELSRAPVEGVLTELPTLPASQAADVTAGYFSNCRCSSRTNVVKPVRRSRLSRSAFRIDCTSAKASSIS